MSKHLVKILTICTLVILLPLTVLGTALCVTEAMGCALTVLASGIEGGLGTSSEVSIYIDNVKQEGGKVVVKKNTEVTVTYAGVGYDFQGWYNGNYDEIKEDDNAVDTKASYTFTVKGNTTLTAVRNVKKYTITYAGLYDDGETTVDLPTEERLYGQSLQPLTPKTTATFNGWYIAESTDVAGVMVANFAESGEYTLNPAWSEQMVVTYKTTAGKIIAQDRLSRTQFDSYSLISSTDERVVKVLTEDLKGYTFAGWVDANGAAIDLANVGFNLNGLDVYISVTRNEYTLSVQKSPVDETKTTLTYNVEDGFSAYNETREGYNLVGLKVGESIYTYDDARKDYFNGTEALSNALFVGNDDKVEAVAVWESKYPTTSFKVYGKYWDAEDSYYYPVYVMQGEDYVLFDPTEYVVMFTTTFTDAEGEGYYDLTDLINDKLQQTYIPVIDSSNPDNVTFKSATLSEDDTVTIYVNGNKAQKVSISDGSSNKVFTYLDIFAALEGQGYDMSTITSLELEFNYV